MLLSRIEGNAERLGKLVEEILTVARVGCESFRVAAHEVSLNVAVERAIAAAGSPLERAGLEVDVRLDPMMPVVNGAADELELVVVNLLTNAATYTPDGGCISISTHHSEANSYIVVADTGVGIPASEQDQIFDPFFRSSISHKRAIQGPGLGLSIAKAVVAAHGGEVSVSSQSGEGTVFIVQLPSAPRAESDGRPHLCLADSSRG
jgi:hypothetical protein